MRDGDTPLDASAIHPESYGVATAALSAGGAEAWRPRPPRAAEPLDALLARTPLPALAAELGAGEPTLRDILEQLVRPGRDPREDLPPPLLRRDVLSLDDLRDGMRLTGTVRNVVDFGAFVDIGVKQDGLLAPQPDAARHHPARRRRDRGSDPARRARTRADRAGVARPMTSDE